MQRSDYEEKIEIDHEWVERIGKTAYDLASNHIKNEEYNGHIIKSGDPVLLECIGLAIQQYLDTMPTKLRVTFQQMLDDIKTRKEDLERS